MTFAARTRESLARELLARLGARHERDGERLDTRVGTPAWLRAQAIAAVLEGLDLQAAGAEDHILPDRAAGMHLSAHAELVEVARAGRRDEPLRAEVLAWWQESMAPMGPDDWITLLSRHPQVKRVFVYPCVNPEVSSDIDAPGTTSIVVLGDPPGDSATWSIGVDLDDVRGWLEGVLDAAGAAAQDIERRPICAHPDSVRLVQASAHAISTVISVENDPTHPWPWHGTLTATSIGATTLVVSGDHTDMVGLPMLVRPRADSVVALSALRGEYIRVVPTAASYDGGTNRTTFTLGATTFQAPFALESPTIDPCPPNWNALRRAVYAYVDALGPGDTSSPRRYPSVDADSPGVAYTSAIRAAMLAVEGVLNATASLTGTVTAPAMTLLDFTFVRFVEM